MGGSDRTLGIAYNCLAWPRWDGLILHRERLGPRLLWLLLLQPDLLPDHLGHFRQQARLRSAFEQCFASLRDFGLVPAGEFPAGEFPDFLDRGRVLDGV